MAARITVVEDDPGIGEAVRSTLVAQGYVVTWLQTGAAAAAALEVDAGDLVLLDVGLPDVDGFTICRWLREHHRNLPIVLLTARDADIDVVVGLDAGANDYVTKPFSMAVLMARVRAQLRTQDPQQAAGPIEVGRLVIDPAAYTAQVENDAVELRPREFELLARLAQDVGRVVSREQLMADVWDMNWAGSSKTLDMHVLALRRKLRDVVVITAVRGVGYRLDPS